jgi:Sec7-like guanine-nucleotide exchange factor
MTTDWLQIDEDAEVDVVDIMRQIKTYLAQNRQHQLMTNQYGLELDFAGYLSQDVYDAFSETLDDGAADTAVKVAVTKSSIPVLGPIMDALRAKFHELVVFYVNRGITRPIALSTHLLRVVGLLLEELDRTKGEVADLRAQLEALQKQ